MTKPLGYYLQLDYPIELRRSPGGGYFATHPDLPGCMAEGGSAEETVANLADSRELWIEARLASGDPVPEPLGDDEPSGRLSLRMLPSLHAELARIAARKDISINLLLNTVLARFAGAASVENDLEAVIRATMTNHLRSLSHGYRINEPSFTQSETSSSEVAATRLASVIRPPQFMAKLDNERDAARA